MRIIAGRFKGRNLPVVYEARPFPGRLRTSLFSVLSGVLPDARVLDLCAGVGAAGLEALSRGAASALLVDRDRAAVQALTEWLERAGAASFGRAVVGDWLQGPLAPGPFDIVFLDPPYAQWGDEVAVAGGLNRVLERLAPGGFLAVKRPAREPSLARPPWRLVRRAEAGNAAYELLTAARGPVDAGGEAAPETAVKPEAPLADS